MNKISAIIPTLQKNVILLENLIKSLDQDDNVDEIIIIDNSLKGIQPISDKLKIITPNENLFVNPSWNLGVKTAKNEIVVLLNDDITIPNDFCKRVAEKMTPNMGIIGFNRDFVETTQDILPPPEQTPLKLEKVYGRCGHFGIAMFFFKSSYVQIPEDIKIYWGDDWLFIQNKRQKRQNYFISNQIIYHWGSLSSLSDIVTPFSKKDSKLFRKYTRKWWQYIFNVEIVFRGIRITIFGLEILKHFSKKH